jgi:hypothetical protein
MKPFRAAPMLNRTTVPGFPAIRLNASSLDMVFVGTSSIDSMRSSGCTRMRKAGEPEMTCSTFRAPVVSSRNVHGSARPILAVSPLNSFATLANSAGSTSLVSGSPKVPASRAPRCGLRRHWSRPCPRIACGSPPGNGRCGYVDIFLVDDLPYRVHESRRRRPDLRLRVASTTDCQNQKDNEEEI